MLGLDEPAVLRIRGLLDRRDALAEELYRLAGAGIHVVTRADADYPSRLRMQLGRSCPPLLYYAGALELAERPAVGYTGVRAAEVADLAFAADTVSKTVGHGFGVVSGGARGVDAAAESAALRAGGSVVSFLPEGRYPEAVGDALGALEDGRLLLLSASAPNAPFHSAAALGRNRYIYAHARAAVVVRANYQRGGTWSGASDNLRHRWSPTLCRDLPGCPGNRELIARGAIPIDARWDGDVDGLLGAVSPAPEQLRLF